MFSKRRSGSKLQRTVLQGLHAMRRQAKQLVISLEMAGEARELRELGLSEEEIQGYFDFYIDNYTRDLGVTNE
jgi:hypothetical protein